MKFLVIQTAFIGDVILATPVIEALHKLYPEASIDVLVRKGNESLLQHFPGIRSVLIWDKKNGKTKNLFRMIGKIRAEQYDEVINLQRFFSTGLITALSGAKVKTGFSKNPLSVSYTNSYAHTIGETGVHETDRNLQLLSHHGWSGRLRPSLYPSTAEFDAIQQYQGRPYVCMAPTSVWFTKQLPPEQWIKLAHLLLAKDPSLNIYLMGGPGDKHACEHIRGAIDSPRVINLCGACSFLQTAALMKGATMNYVNDSAPLHIASSMNAPVRAFFCSTVPAFGFGPLSDDAAILELKEPLSCRPCGLHGKKACPEGHFKCGFGIEVG